MARRRRPYVELSDDAVRCRTYGHAWDEFHPIDMRKRGGGWGAWRIHLRCIRCTTERHDIFDRNMQLQGRYYEYPEDYRSLGKRDLPALRRELRVRVMKPGSVRGVA